MNTETKILIGISTISIVGGILAWQYFGAPKEEVKVPEEKIPEEITKDETADWKIYRNEKYGYEFKYPPDYFLKEVLGWEGTPTGRLLLREIGGREWEWLIEVWIDDGISKEIEFFEEYAVKRIRASCDADGVRGSQYCTNVVKKETFINENGIKGYKIYITEVSESYKNGVEISERIKGPIFAFDISQQTNLARGLFFELIRTEEEKESLIKIFNQIVSTLRFLK